jgi:hypothetical protein
MLERRRRLSLWIEYSTAQHSICYHNIRSEHSRTELQVKQHGLCCSGCSRVLCLCCKGCSAQYAATAGLAGTFLGFVVGVSVSVGQGSGPSVAV